MSSARSRNCSLHSSRTAADNQNLLFSFRLQKGFRPLDLLSLLWIYRAFYDLQLAGGSKTLITSQTGSNILFTSLQSLLCNIGICNQSAAYLYQISLSVCNDFFHLFRIVQGPYTRNRFCDMFFDLCRQIHIDTSREKGIWMCPAEHCRIFMVSA